MVLFETQFCYWFWLVEEIKICHKEIILIRDKEVMRFSRKSYQELNKFSVHKTVDL